MSQEWQQLQSLFDGILSRYGLIHCLFALAHSVRGVNDRVPAAGDLDPDTEQVHYLREYIANQITGAAAFWGVYRRACGDR